MTHVAGVTSCPDCLVSYTPTVVTDGRPGQVLAQTCPECGHETRIGVLWYPDGHYEVIGALAPAVTDTQCARCRSEATYAVVDNRNSVATYYCDSCFRPHHRSVYEEVDAVAEN